LQAFIIRPILPKEIDVYEGSKILRSYGSKRNLIAILKLFKYARKYRHDIFHAFNIGPFYLTTLHLAGVKKIIYSIHGTNYWNNGRERLVRKILWKFILTREQVITSNSEYSKSVFHQKINKNTDIKILYNPIGGKNFYPKKGRNRSGNFKIIYVGRLDIGKNLEKWIDLACELHKDLADIEFDIFGSGALDEALRLRIEKLNASNYIFLRGFRKDIENVYREADLLLFLSENESFGNVVVESVLCGTPVIASDIPSMREIFCDFPEFLVSINSKIRQVIYEKLLNYSRLCDLTALACQSFSKRFSEKSYINYLNILYHSFDDKLL
jgi:glycosyltransferase involved in cell wall biosynthesis